MRDSEQLPYIVDLWAEDELTVSCLAKAAERTIALMAFDAAAVSYPQRVVTVRGPGLNETRAFGAEGIGLCRTEHMFMARDRLPAHAPDDPGRRRRDPRRGARPAAADAARGLHRDLRRRWPACRSPCGCSTRRCTSSCPTGWSSRCSSTGCRAAASATGSSGSPTASRPLAEQNPMLGTRGSRLGILHPDIYRMQVRAIVRGALDAARSGPAVRDRDHAPADHLAGRADAAAGPGRGDGGGGAEAGGGSAAGSWSGR